MNPESQYLVGLMDVRIALPKADEHFCEVQLK
jgi:ribosomal protein S4E